MTTTVRPSRPDDYRAFAALFAELGHDDPVPPEAMFARMQATMFFAERAGQPVGYVYFRSAQGRGLVSNLVVTRHARGSGVGEQLLRLAGRTLREASCATWSLNVDQHNRVARRLYHKLGFREAGRTTLLRFDWQAVANIQPAGVDLEVVDVSSVDRLDGQLAAGLDAPSGMVQSLRRPDGETVLLAAFEGSAPVGFACFRPDFPVVTRLLAPSLDVAVGLLQAMMRYRVHIASDPERLWRQREVQIVLENRLELVEAIERAGARVAYRLLAMAGDIPSLASRR